MNPEKHIYLPFTKVQESEKKDLRFTVANYLYHWPIFVVCILLAVGVAFFYVQSSKPVYLVKARIAIKDEKSNAASEKEEALQQLNMSSKPKLIESEVEIIRSRPILRKLVSELELWISYTDLQNFKEIDLYKSAPVHFKLMKSSKPVQELRYEIKILSPSRFSLAKPNAKAIEAGFGTTIRSEFGEWKLTRNPNLKDWVGKTIYITLRNPDKVTNEYQAKIAATINKTAPIIDLKIADEVPERGEFVLNKLIEDYKEFNINEKNQETASTLRFINERLTSLTGELNDAEKNVEGYKSSIGLTDISSKSQYYLQNTQVNDERINEVNVQLKVIGEIEKYAMSDSQENVPATLGITDPGLISLVEQLSRLQLQREKLLSITPENNPIFMPLNKQINSTKMAVRQNIQSIKASLSSTRGELNKINSKFEGSIRSIPGQERQYVSIKRQQGTKETLYLYLLQKREEIAMSYASTLTDVHIVEKAYTEESKSPVPFVYSFAFLSGFLVPFGFIFSRQVIQNKVLTRKEIEKITSVEIISELARENSTSSIVISNSRATSPIGEQFRALRVNLLSLHDRMDRGKVVLLTSSISGEGKSFVSSNIAASLAISRRKTIILELDLRKPKLTTIFDLDRSKPGLSELLSGNASKEEVIQQTKLNPDLYAMRAGMPTNNPSELLEGVLMEKLISELRLEFDTILIDSPPLRLVPDAMILASMSDVTLYLIRQGYTGKEELEFIKQLQEDNKLPNLRLVFNGVENGKYGYGYSYDYSYYDGVNRNTPAFYVKDILNRF